MTLNFDLKQFNPEQYLSLQTILHKRSFNISKNLSKQNKKYQETNEKKSNNKVIRKLSLRFSQWSEVKKGRVGV
jgi:hypothetical protein